MHNIYSLFLPLPLPGDRLEARLLASPTLLAADPFIGEPPLTRFFDDFGAPLAGIKPDDNTLTRAWTWFRALCGFAPPLGITVRKSVPHGAGLGGGSANAAALLLFLRKLAKKQGLPLPKKEDFVRQSAEVGADVPFFLLNRPALARGVGERLCPCANPFAGQYLLLLCPDLPVNTGQAFAALDRWREEGRAPLPQDVEEKGPGDWALSTPADCLRRPGALPPAPPPGALPPAPPPGALPPAPPPGALPLDPGRGMMPLHPRYGRQSSGASGPLCDSPSGPAPGYDFVNDFEGPIFHQLPELFALHAELAASGALLARMSGSGSSLFALYSDGKIASKMVKTLADRGLRVYMQPLPQR